MDFRMKITLTLPEEMIKTMGITEDTLFITSYENGQIQIEEYDDYMQAELSKAFESGYKRGTLQGYADGYCCGFGDAHERLPYNYYYRGRVNEFHDHPAEMPCHQNCRCKNTH